jgi:hypothetical protein
MSTVSNWRGPNIVKDGLLLYLDASSPNSYSSYFSGTTWKDISSNGNDGTLVNGPIFNNDGKLSSFSFDGIDDYVDTVDVPLRITGYNFTVEFVFFYNNSTYTAIPLVAKRNPNTPFNQWSFNISGGNPYTTGSGKVLTCFLRDDNNPNSQTFDRILTYTLPSAGIYHVIVTTSQVNSQLWVNGVQRSISSVVLSSGNFQSVGYNFRMANVYTASYWDNKFYLCRIYRKTFSSTEILQNYNATLQQNYDTDAIIFITAAEINDITQRAAVNQLVIDLKNYGIWNKLKAVYPFVGGTASSHKFNLKDPRDLDVAFRLVFNGGWTHSSNGVQGNGTNAWANTFLRPSVNLINNSTHVSVYSRTDLLQSSMDIGVYKAQLASTSSGRIFIFSRHATGNLFAQQYNEATNNITYLNPNSLGLFLSNRTDGTTFKMFKNTAIVGTNTNVSSPNISDITGPFAIGAGYEMINSNVFEYFSSRQYAFTSIGDGLTDTEANNFYTAIQDFQTTLGRQV